MNLIKLRLIFLVLVISTTYSCKEKLFTGSVDCDKCYSIKPDSADLIVHLTYNSTYNAIPLVIYRDEVNENNVDYVDTAYDATYYLYSAVDQKYAIKAEYNDGVKTIYAIDASKLVIKRVSDACDETCWVIEGGEMNVRLKFE